MTKLTRIYIFLFVCFREEPPSLASGIEEHDLEVGSDEDGELEAYNMDPGKLIIILS